MNRGEGQRCEERLQDSEARLRAILEATPECVKIVDPEGRIRFMNPAGLALLEAEALDNVPVADLIAAEHREEWLANHARVCAGEHLSWEFDVVGRSGKRRRLETHAVPLEVPDGSVQHLAVTRDVTQRRIAEDRLRKSEMLLAAFMKNAPVGMYLKDSQGRYVMLNPEMGKVFGGRPVDELIGLTAGDLLSAEEAEMVAAYDREILETGRPKAVEEFLPGIDSYSWSLVVRFPVATGTGEPAGIGGFDIDITDQKEAEEELRRSRDALHQSEKLSALGSLLAGVAHELNNPLTAIVGQAELLEEDTLGTPLEARARKIGTAAERCAKIVHTFLAMARRNEPQRSLIPLNELVAAALDITDYALRTSGIAVRVVHGAPEPVVEGDRDLLHQVLVNLIVNAQHAMEKGRAFEKILTIRTSTDAAGRVRLDFTDTGPGVAPEHAGRIFEPFFTTKATGSGTGIGLSFSQGIVEAHGGTLTLQPSRRGAHFRITLPAAAPAGAKTAEPAPQAPAKPAPTPRRRVLIVDDEADVAETLRELIEREGYEVSVAGGGSDAIAALEDQDFDILLSDLRMPMMSGPELYERLREIRPEMVGRIAFVTGDTVGERMAEFLHGCGRPVLEKPFTRATVRAALAALTTP